MPLIVSLWLKLLIYDSNWPAGLLLSFAQAYVLVQVQHVIDLWSLALRFLVAASALQAAGLPSQQT